MQLRGSAVGAFMVVGVLIAACSTSPSHPPIDTSGSTTGSQGGGHSPPSEGGTIEDGGTVVVADSGEDAGVSCNAAPCLGCCTAGTNLCQAGTSNSQCGISGGLCSPCPGAQTCIGGACQ